MMLPLLKFKILEILTGIHSIVEAHAGQFLLSMFVIIVKEMENFSDYRKFKFIFYESLRLSPTTEQDRF